MWMHLSPELQGKVPKLLVAGIALSIFLWAGLSINLFNSTLPLIRALVRSAPVVNYCRHLTLEINVDGLPHGAEEIIFKAFGINIHLALFSTDTARYVPVVKMGLKWLLSYIPDQQCYLVRSGHTMAMSNLSLCIMLVGSEQQCTLDWHDPCHSASAIGHIKPL